jgi:hypothetical protein
MCPIKREIETSTETRAIRSSETLKELETQRYFSCRKYIVQGNIQNKRIAKRVEKVRMRTDLWSSHKM